MTLNFNQKRKIAIVAMASTIIGYIGCTKERSGNNGLDANNLTAGFTITPVAGKTNTYALKAQETGVINVKWDIGDGSGLAPGKTVDTVFYPDAGKYTITLKAVGIGGVEKTATQDLTVATSDPVRGNLLQGAKMAPGDEAKWTTLNLSAVPLTLTYANNKLTFSGGASSHTGIYQAVQVQANKKYKVDMAVSGSGATDTWFEVYVGQAVPVQGQDYNDGGTRLALNTWNGCGKTAFSGKLSAISCGGSGGGVVSFPTAGTAYVVIRTGGSNLGATGISVTNLELRPVE
ncbi:PKD domain-containing protein [Mucilaginibacter lacusdianchii]|uniref:PKD domain-containing protein n=1 Tax=Mucilaginibacter lacusdianchii TaxID=2684211 RepID=UPI00131E1CBD|nr:PKD domain-containing protein [Mucilaginibacter sp. JXJ CY 39]